MDEQKQRLVVDHLMHSLEQAIAAAKPGERYCRVKLGFDDREVVIVVDLQTGRILDEVGNDFNIS